jgi:two-component system nitrate/nitrite response regulator NarL
VLNGAEEFRVRDVTRVLVCDDHLVFAESLANLLTASGHQVVAVTDHPDRAIAVLRRAEVDICLLDVMFGEHSVVARLPDLRCASPLTRVVLLSGQVDDALITAGRAAGVRGVADKRQPVSEILSMIARVTAGEIVLPAPIASASSARTARMKPANDAQRLAAFLTPREREVLGALVRGHDTKKIARAMGIASATARCHVQSVLTKFGAHSRLEAATTAVRWGMVNPETGAWLVDFR